MSTSLNPSLELLSAPQVFFERQGSSCLAAETMQAFNGNCSFPSVFTAVFVGERP